MDPRNIVEAEVAERARSGDLEAFQTLVRAHDHNFRMFAARLVGSERTDDVLQDAYLKAFRAIRRQEGPNQSIWGWFFRIVYNACLDELRRKKRTQREQFDLSDSAMDPGAPPDEVVMDRIALTHALFRLTPEHRAAVVLVDALGFDYPEAARILGIRRGTLASRLHHARTSLRQALRPHRESLNSG
ncbi:MAG: RNA polymerase sigma factor [Acidimicrobiia bacterium]